MIASLLLSLLACGGGEPAPAPVAQAPAPAPTPAPVAAYIPDALASKAYAAAKAAGADAVTANPKAGDAAAIEKGKAAYTAKCAACHGANGLGDGAAGAALPQKPANFHDKGRWDHTSHGVKAWILKNGIAGSAMAGIVPDENEANDLLAYIASEFVGK
jgi:mono/diheme cytochrome c family protein